MTKIKVRPEVGGEYLLAYSENPEKQDSVKGIYIGRNPIVFGEGWGILFAKTPEGHIFTRINRKGEAEIFHTGTLEDEIPLLWYSDGEDGPEWPAGFGVSKLNPEYLSPKIRRYLEERVKRFESNKLGVAA